MRIKAVVFDLDDTLISEKEYIESGYNHISKIISRDLGLDPSTIYNNLLTLFNTSTDRVFNRLYMKYNHKYTDETIQYLVNEYRSHFPCIQFFDDVIPCINKLRALGIKTGIITDGFAVSQRLKLRAIEASKYFDEIIITDELGREYWKPHQKPFELMKEKLKVDFNNMIYIGDNPMKDFYIAQIYPITTLRIIRKNAVHLTKPYYKSVREDFAIQSLNEIGNYL